MRLEAEERRKTQSENFSHPLNSERRRANRRKPGKSMLIKKAKDHAKKERYDPKNQGPNNSKAWNNSGFEMRRGKGKY